MDAIDYVGILRRRWPVIALVAFIGAIMAVLTAPRSDATSNATYRATHTLALETPFVNEPERVLASYAFLAAVGETPRKAAAAIGPNEDVAALTASVTVQSNALEGSLRVSASSRSPARAVQVADAYADALVTKVAELSAAARQAQLDAATASVAALEAQIREAEEAVSSATSPTDAGLAAARRDSLIRQLGFAYDTSRATPTGGGIAALVSVERAAALRAPGSGLQPPTSLPARLAIAVVIGLLLGLGLAMVLERVDQRIRSKEAAEAAFGLPTIAEIPSFSRRHRRAGLVAVVAPASPAAESFRLLRTAVLFSRFRSLAADQDVSSVAALMSARRRQVILIASAASGEGRSTTAANLAAVFAQSGKSVLLLDCDFRRPGLHSLLDMPGGPGLAQLRAGTTDPNELRALAQETTVDNLWLVSSGTSAERRVESSVVNETLVTMARSLADVVLIDTPPLLMDNTASELCSAVDVVVSCCRVGRTSEEAAQRAAELLTRLDAPALGVALIGGASFGQRSDHRQSQLGHVRARQLLARGAPSSPPAESTVGPPPPAVTTPVPNGKPPSGSLLARRDPRQP